MNNAVADAIEFANNTLDRKSNTVNGWARDFTVQRPDRPTFDELDIRTTLLWEVFDLLYPGVELISDPDLALIKARSGSPEVGHLVDEFIDEVAHLSNDQLAEVFQAVEDRLNEE